MLNHRGNSLGLIAGLVVSLILAACAPAGVPAANPSGSLAPKSFRVLLPFDIGIDFFPVPLAKDLGYLQQEGFQIDLQAVGGGGLVVQQLAAGNADIGLVLGPGTLLGSAAGAKYKAFYDLWYKNANQLVTLEGSSIAAVKDLKGKNVGVTDLNDGAMPELRAILKVAGLELGTDVKLLPLGHGGPGWINSMPNNVVSALFSPWGQLSPLHVAGQKTRCLNCDASAPKVAQFVSLVRDEVLQRDRAYVAAFGRAIAKASLFAETNPDAAYAIMKRIAPAQFADAAESKEHMQTAIDMYKPREAGKYGAIDRKSWDLLQEYMLAAGGGTGQLGLSRQVDLNALLVTDLTTEFNRFDAEAVRKQAREYKP